jgi:hypothetical protein
LFSTINSNFFLEKGYRHHGGSKAKDFMSGNDEKKREKKKTLTNWKLHIELVAFIFKES